MLALLLRVIVTAKYMRVIWSLLLLSLAGIAAPLSAATNGSEAEARKLLDKMTTATRTLNYDGIFVYQHNNRMDAMRIIHKVENGRERERLLALSGPAREVIRNDQSVTCIFPDDHSVLVEKSRPYKLLSAQFPDRVAELADSYVFTVAGDERTAGRDARIIEIMPRDRFRYGYRLWIDRDTHLLLKSELLGEQNRPLEQFMFTRLEVLEHIPDSKLQPSITGSDYTWYENAGNGDNPSMDDAWQVGWLPQGFSISNRADELLADSARHVHHLVFSDGLAMVSVFVEQKSNQRGVMVGPSRMGAVNAYAREADGYQVMVVGEVPQSTVRKMAESVSHNQ